MANELHTFTGNEIIATEVPKYLNDNFSALNSVDEDIKTQLGTKAPLASPTLTGTPKAPTASEGTNTTQIATTAFVASAVKVKSVNGKTGDVVVGEIVDATISGRTITLTFADGTTRTLTTQDTTGVTPSRYITSKWTSGTSWYEVYNDGWVRQGGEFTFTSTENTITLHKSFNSTNYNVQITQRCNHSSSWNNNVWLKVKTSASAFIARGEVNTGSKNGFCWVAEGRGA